MHLKKLARYQSVLATSLTLHLVKVLRPIQHNVGHFGDVLPSQSLGVVLTKLKTKANNTQPRLKRKQKNTKCLTLTNTQKLNLNQQRKNCSRVRVSLCTTVAAQNCSDNFPSYPPESHHCSDDVY